MRAPGRIYTGPSQRGRAGQGGTGRIAPCASVTGRRVQGWNRAGKRNSPTILPGRIARLLVSILPSREGEPCLDHLSPDLVAIVSIRSFPREKENLSHCGWLAGLSNRFNPLLPSREGEPYPAGSQTRDHPFQSAPSLARRRTLLAVGSELFPVVSIRSFPREKENHGPTPASSRPTWFQSAPSLARRRTSGHLGNLGRQSKFQSAPSLARRRTRMLAAIADASTCFNPLLPSREGEPKHPSASGLASCGFNPLLPSREGEPGSTEVQPG